MRRSDVELWRAPALLQAEPTPSFHLRRGSQQDICEALRRLTTATHERPRRGPEGAAVTGRGPRRGWWRLLWGRA